MRALILSVILLVLLVSCTVIEVRHRTTDGTIYVFEKGLRITPPVRADNTAP